MMANAPRLMICFASLSMFLSCSMSRSVLYDKYKKKSSDHEHCQFFMTKFATWEHTYVSDFTTFTGKSPQMVPQVYVTRAIVLIFVKFQ